ncbi:hypothetical protein DRQ50_11590, partial [bacterium]
GGTNHPDNLTTLCSACHRLRHEQSTLYRQHLVPGPQ